MADNLTPLPVKTKTNGDVVAAIVDAAGTNKAAVSAAGAVKVDASTVAVPVTDNSGSLTVDNAGTFAVQDSEKVADNAAFTDGTTKVMPLGAIYDEVAGTALTENDIAAPRIDVKRALVLTLEDATTRGQRASVSAGGAVKVDASSVAVPVTNAGTFAVQDSEKLTDNGAFVDGTSKVMMAGFAFDETAGTGLTENDAAAARVDSKRAQVIAIEDATTRGQRLAVSAGGAMKTELPTAAALADNTANPTVPGVGAFLMGWDSAGTNWDRVKMNAAGELVVTTATSITAAKTDVLTSAALAALGNVTVQGTQVASGKTGKLMGFVASSSVPLKIEIQTVLNNGAGTTKVVLFTSAANPTVSYNCPDKSFIVQAESVTAGFDGFAVKWTNLDPVNAGDVYATLFWDEV